MGGAVLTSWRGSRAGGHGISSKRGRGGARCAVGTVGGAGMPAVRRSTCARAVCVVTWGR